METTGMQVWSAPEDFEDFLSAGGNGFIFKHSTRCSISSEAYGQVERFASDVPAAPVHVVLVIENRATSSAVAEKLGVPHASPQAILVEGGVARWHSSHWEITKKSLEDAWRTVEAS